MSGCNNISWSPSANLASKSGLQSIWSTTRPKNTNYDHVSDYLWDRCEKCFSQMQSMLNNHQLEIPVFLFALLNTGQALPWSIKRPACNSPRWWLVPGCYRYASLDFLRYLEEIEMTWYQVVNSSPMAKMVAAMIFMASYSSRRRFNNIHRSIGCNDASLTGVERANKHLMMTWLWTLRLERAIQWDGLKQLWLIRLPLLSLKVPSMLIFFVPLHQIINPSVHQSACPFVHRTIHGPFLQLGLACCKAHPNRVSCDRADRKAQPQAPRSIFNPIVFCFSCSVAIDASYPVFLMGRKCQWNPGLRGKCDMRGFYIWWRTCM